MDSKTRIKNYIKEIFPEWERVDFAEFGEEINFKRDLCDIFRIKNGELIIIAYANISITGSDRVKPQLRVFLDEYKRHFLFAKNRQMRFYLLSIFTKDDDMARGLNNFNSKEYIISIETNLDVEGARRDLRSIYDYANNTLNGEKFLKCTRANYSSDINQASFIYIGHEDNPEKATFENFINMFDSRPYINSTFADGNRIKAQIEFSDLEENSLPPSYLRAMRTKPFLLLAGISGTGKSRVVKQMAFDSCPDNNVLRSDLTSPGNYCLIEVKPNWHDSTELLGYHSKIGGANYHLTPFVKFLAKAMLYPDVPFFVCLDEMNLAPVEQYFAEFLSVLESRKKLSNGHIVSEPLIKASVFSNIAYEKDLKHDIFDVKIKEKDANGIKIYESDLTDEEVAVYNQLKEQGLRIPENVVIIGTVNMDETTHQFSRKVIDRAMTIEMNLPEGKDAEGKDINPFMNFFDNVSELEYRDNPITASDYIATETKASDVIKELADVSVEKTEWLKWEVAKVLSGINAALEGTPFKVAYRVQNELLLYFYQLWLEDKTAEWRDILTTTTDQILMMKVLPRVEGDELLLETPLAELKTFCDNNGLTNASKKIKEMSDRLNRSKFTSYWP